MDFYLEDLKTKFLKINPNEYYLSYSGGKDSHFLYWFIKEYAKIKGIEIVGCNTYMEHTEIRKRIYDNSDRVLLPDMKPMEIKEKFRYSVFQQRARFLYLLLSKCFKKRKKPAKTIQQKIDGNYDKGFSGISKKAREYIKSGNAHKITHLCCYYLKKKPFHDYEKESGKKAILGVRGQESALRKKQYQSCFTKDKKFTPIYDLTNELLEEIIKKYNIEVPKVYEKIDRTGCMGCPYGSYKHETEKELELINLKQKEFVCNLFKESYNVLGIKY